MGIVFSSWRKKKSRIEILNDLTKTIEKMERQRQGNLERQKRVVTRLLLYSVLIYFISALVLFLYFMPDTTLWKVAYSLPFLVFPLLIWAIKRFLHWYYVKNIEKNEKELEKLKNRKIHLLNEVKATETYNVAQELLQRFDPDNSIQDSHNNTILGASVVSPKKLGGTESTLRQRGKLNKTQQEHDKSLLKSPQQQQQQQQPQQLQQQQIPKLPFNMPEASKSMLKRDRSFFDRLVDYLLSDGPGSRYALICAHCHCHNGLALKEEFEFMTYRCSYCSFLNQAPKQKPRAPMINQSISQPTNPSTPKHPSNPPNGSNTPRQPSSQPTIQATPLATIQPTKESKSD